jgi:hypothetical protein
MTTENPYEAPEHSPPPDLRMLWRSGAFVLAAAVIGGLGGLAIGALVGTVAPEYYRAVVPGGAAENFDPLAVGIGFGIIQGSIGGAGVGVVLVALFYWFRSRSARNRMLDDTN